MLLDCPFCGKKHFRAQDCPHYGKDGDALGGPRSLHADIATEDTTDVLDPPKHPELKNEAPVAPKLPTPKPKGKKQQKATFDRNAYQRTYMREYRAAKAAGLTVAEYRKRQNGSDL